MTVAIEATETTVQDLLERIERGDQVQLKKNGQTIAILSPAAANDEPLKRSPVQIADARAALEDVRKLSAELNLGPFDFGKFKADRDLGRR